MAAKFGVPGLPARRRRRAVRVRPAPLHLRLHLCRRLARGPHPGVRGSPPRALRRSREDPGRPLRAARAPGYSIEMNPESLNEFEFPTGSAWATGREEHPMNGRVAAVLGVGPGLGAAVARRFAGEGFAVAMMARRRGEPRGDAAGDRGRRRYGAPRLRRRHGRRLRRGGLRAGARGARRPRGPGLQRRRLPDGRRYWRFDRDSSTSASGQTAPALSTPLGEVLPAMVEAGRGTILLTGASAALRGSARFSALAVGKFGSGRWPSPWRGSSGRRGYTSRTSS